MLLVPMTGVYCSITLLDIRMANHLVRQVAVENTVFAVMVRISVAMVALRTVMPLLCVVNSVRMLICHAVCNSAVRLRVGVV